MSRNPHHKFPIEIEEIRAGIEAWRKTRLKRSPMPAELWEAAVSFSRTHGVSPIARALGVGYKSLKMKTDSGNGVLAPVPGVPEGRESPPGGFVELRATDIFGTSPSPGPVVELIEGDGAQLTIHLIGDGGLDVPGLVRAFRGR